MPLPMIHCAVAVKYFDDKEIPAAFLLGNIAPDAIHMRKNTTREDKKRTHLNFESDGQVLDYAKGKYEEYIAQSPDEEWKWFVRGYFAHLLTDYYCLHSVYSVFKDKALFNRLTKDEMRRAYYKDTDQIDFNFYRNKPWTGEVWSRLIQAKTVDFKPYLTADEIHYWRFRVVHWFDLLSKEPGVEPRYITEPMAENFIVEAAGRVKAEIERWDRAIPHRREGVV